MIELREATSVVIDRLDQEKRKLVLSVVSVVELENGVIGALEGRARRREVLDEIYRTVEILDFGAKEAVAYREIVGRLGFSRRMTFDRMIAAQALVAGAVVATLNPRDFRLVSGLVAEDWSI